MSHFLLDLIWYWLDKEMLLGIEPVSQKCASDDTASDGPTLQ